MYRAVFANRSYLQNIVARRRPVLLLLKIVLTCPMNPLLILSFYRLLARLGYLSRSALRRVRYWYILLTRNRTLGCLRSWKGYR